LSTLAARSERAALDRAVEQSVVDRQLVEARAARAEENVASLTAALERKDQDLAIAHEAMRRLGQIVPVAAQVPAAIEIHACTIVARNYLPYARVWSRSLKAVHPDAAVTVLVIDGDADASDASLFRAV